MEDKEVKFEIDVSRIDHKYGLTICLYENEKDPDESPCFFMVFDGPAGQDPVEVARSFGQCHQDAMDTVGLKGELTEEQFTTKLDDSIILAGELMGRHGFISLELDKVDEGMLAALFAEEPTSDPSLLN
jgi:serine/threonine protein phosphatase PrpC